MTSLQSPPTLELSADEARRTVLRAQGFLGAPDRRAGVRGVLRSLGSVQLDTISVLARSHELVPYARLGAVGRGAVESAYWTQTHAFEYWSHAACILPIEEWPLFAFRRRAYRARPQWYHELAGGVYDRVIKQLRDEGPLTATELGGAKNGGPWWDWSEAKVAVERALMYGDVVCVERRGWKRVYDLAERAVPGELLHDDLDERECVRRLVEQAGAAMGVATRADLADYHRLKAEQVDAVLPDSGLVPVVVEGWGRPAWAHPTALESAPRGRHRTTLLSPFDSLIWDRPRTERIFGFTHRLEAYVPKPKRVHGYFAMPLLAGGRLVGRVDPARDGRTLVARQLSVENRRAVEPMAQALAEAASWVDCTDVRVERMDREELRGPLAAALARILG
ncbi:winged helix-turn-helix domain-containing protein [Streptomyces sp. GC420]|uniref:winged helix-turn-helix domain-containing protein n=1 Tax=Streptomyces sp. GC420 TaxID=2697568 RepID=UPI001414D53D|nr:crosslink repair DNA glycosylase YcaQ family protein [Streptomyces sp. GC420]NBM17876.1 winged helix-turn-helix domain-containing protein [Streptomyces sp. GC420]